MKLVFDLEANAKHFYRYVRDRFATPNYHLNENVVTITFDPQNKKKHTNTTSPSFLIRLNILAFRFVSSQITVLSALSADSIVEMKSDCLFVTSFSKAFEYLYPGQLSEGAISLRRSSRLLMKVVSGLSLRIPLAQVLFPEAGAPRVIISLLIISSPD